MQELPICLRTTSALINKVNVIKVHSVKIQMCENVYIFSRKVVDKVISDDADPEAIKRL